MSTTRQLNNQEREIAKEILDRIRELITKATQEDSELAFALRRYICRQLTFDEKGKPAQRKKLKYSKLLKQGGKCAECGKQFLEGEEPELDRFDAMKGYTDENTRLVCHECHRQMQAKRGFH